MTDTVSPFTGPQLTPMFATGAQPVAAPNTEPHHAPIFDTGPHPDPLRAAGTAIDDEPGNEAEPVIAPVAESKSVPETGSPDTDTAAPQAFSSAENPAHHPTQHSAGDPDTDPFLRAPNGHLPTAVTAHPVTVPSGHNFVKRWKFAAIVAGVWVLAATAGLGFYFWWYTALNKTMPVFGILLFLIGCVVASMLISMVPNRPQVTALAIALMAAPLASMAAAAILHGAYYFEWIARPVIG